MLPARHPIPFHPPVLGTSTDPQNGPASYRARHSSWAFRTSGDMAHSRMRQPPVAVQTHFRVRSLPDWKASALPGRTGESGGPSRVRTDDLPLAGRMLFQLSYRPEIGAGYGSRTRFFDLEGQGTAHIPNPQIRPPALPGNLAVPQEAPRYGGLKPRYACRLRKDRSLRKKSGQPTPVCFQPTPITAIPACRAERLVFLDTPG